MVGEPTGRVPRAGVISTRNIQRTDTEGPSTSPVLFLSAFLSGTSSCPVPFCYTLKLRCSAGSPWRLPSRFYRCAV